MRWSIEESSSLVPSRRYFSPSSLAAARHESLLRDHPGTATHHGDAHNDAAVMSPARPAGDGEARKEDFFSQPSDASGVDWRSLGVRLAAKARPASSGDTNRARWM
eukprot:Selendium_serpulae@DN2582_c0_g1_i1.p1